ncbi:MAG: hypothetical protein IKV75_01785 [Bacteroidales bacterium]|nr:hypothetical protein [Bacteroidales bacterium]
MFRKIHIAIDCENEQEYAVVQKIAEEISSVMRLSAKELVAVYPEIKKRYGLIAVGKQAIKKDGRKGLLAIVGQLIRGA